MNFLAQKPRCQCFKACARVQLRPLLAAVVAVAIVVAGAAGASNIRLPGCSTSCGDVTVPYPFSIGAGCHLEHPSFNLTCFTTDDRGPPQLLLTGNDERTEIMKSISLDASTVLVLGSFFTYVPPEDHSTHSTCHAITADHINMVEED
ncbi:uncharacterized protein [Miscanthus floridulus]|uniref:uncharacterized protein n=1 Tax=Miscanthus floridulus TaxID=154761 RepID=UPI00345A1C62